MGLRWRARRVFHLLASVCLDVTLFLFLISELSPCLGLSGLWIGAVMFVLLAFQSSLLDRPCWKHAGFIGLMADHDVRIAVASRRG